MKYFLRLFLTFALILVTISINAGTTYGCQDYYTMKIGERLTLRRNIGHYPSNWTRVFWFIGYSGESVKIVSQDYDYCTIEAEAECSNVPVYCQMYYNGDLSTLYYDITVKSNGKLTITASPAGGSVVLPGEKVTLSTNYSGATIYYTLNGSTPTTYSSVYTSSGITIDNSCTFCTLKALAVKSGYTDSNVLTANYFVSKTFTAKTVEGVDMKFNITDVTAKTCEVYQLAIDKSTKGKVTIPSSVNGYTVTRIRDYAFNGCSGITSIIIPNSVIEIGSGAFWNCSSLESITLPSSVTSLGTYAFASCKSLTSIDIPNSITALEEYVFWGCSKLEEVSLPTSLTRVGDYTFSACNSLTKLNAGNKIEYIGTNAITNCPWSQNLPDGMNFLGKVLFKHKGEVPANTTINIPAGCTQIYDGAITGKDGLVGVNIPSSVSKIASGAFNNCPDLQTITVDAANSAYDSRNNCNAVIETATNTLIQGCSSTTIPNNVTSIGASAFYGNWTKDEILVPNQIDSIAGSAFRGNNSVKSILIGKGLRKIGSYAFAQLPQLKEITVATGNTYFDSRNNCNAIIEKTTNTLVVGCSETTIPNTIKTIGNYAFYGNGNESFTSLVVPNSVEEIKAYAFENLSHLRFVTIGENVKTFGNYIFYGCKNLEAIESLNGFPEDIGENVFNSGDSKYSFYDNVTLYVPVGCRNNYRLATGWSNFKNIVEGSIKDGIDDIFTTQMGKKTIYSPTGIRLSVPQRGINIVNGKKLLVK